MCKPLMEKPAITLPVNQAGNALPSTVKLFEVYLIKKRFFHSVYFVNSE